MAFSLLLLTIFCIVPSLLFVFIFQLNRVPIKLSFSEVKNPLQVGILGVFLSMIPYLLSGFLLSGTVELNLFQPFLGIVEVIKPEHVRWNIRFWDWLTFLVVYYCLCGVMGAGLSAMINSSEVFLDKLEQFDLIDEKVMAVTHANRSVCEVDITVTGLDSIFSGTLENRSKPNFLNRETLVLNKVLKVPMKYSDCTLEEYLKMLKLQSIEPVYLEQLSIPKDKISTFHIKTSLNQNFKVNFN